MLFRSLNIKDVVTIPMMEEIYLNENPDTVSNELIEKKYSIGFQLRCSVRPIAEIIYNLGEVKLIRENRETLVFNDPEKFHVLFIKDLEHILTRPWVNIKSDVEDSEFSLYEFKCAVADLYGSMVATDENKYVRRPTHKKLRRWLEKFEK